MYGKQNHIQRKYVCKKKIMRNKMSFQVHIIDKRHKQLRLYNMYAKQALIYSYYKFKFLCKTKS